MLTHECCPLFFMGAAVDIFILDLFGLIVVNKFCDHEK